MSLTKDPVASAAQIVADRVWNIVIGKEIDPDQRTRHQAAGLSL
jgi:hypothetical protein